MMTTIRILCVFILSMVLSFRVSEAVEFDPILLPDGTPFVTWEQPQSYTRTYHVNQNHPRASDRNKGTEKRPWKTINRAARTLNPGERVIIHEGVYREWVDPARGGTGPDSMIAYQAAPGEKVVITGSDVWKPTWERSRYFKLKDVVTWQAELTPDLFEGANTFCLQNFPIQTDLKTWILFPSNELRRGQLFVDGEFLTQVSDFAQLAEAAGRYWVEDNGMTVHLRMPGDADPQTHVFEITTREQVFAPRTAYLNYIRVSGLTMTRSANGVPIPPPQRGLLSTTRGHHWIIEDCEISHANTLGMDFGGQWWSYGVGEAQGYHIIRRNYIHHCGMCSMSGWHNMPNESLLIEDNLITDTCWMPIPNHYESAGIKVHRTENSVVRRNVILRTINGSSIWLDGEIFNTRITQNVMYDPGDGLECFGLLFLEINKGPNLCDNNILIGSENNGFHEHDAERVILVQNLFANGKNCGVHLGSGDPKRVNPPYENHHRVFGNIVTGFPQYALRPNHTSFFDFNLLAGADPAQAFAEGKDEKPLTLADWRSLGQDSHSVFADIEVRFDDRSLTLRLQSSLAAIPTFQSFPELLPEVAPAETLLTHDLLGRPRPTGAFQIGPLIDPPLDGTPIVIDPRHR